MRLGFISILVFASMRLFAESAQFPVPAVSAERCRFILAEFADGMLKSGCGSGALCAVWNGRTIMAEHIQISDSPEGNDQKFALGKTSAELVRICAAEMEKSGKLNAGAPFSSQCSLFRMKMGGKSSLASLEDLLGMRAGVDPHADSLVPREASAEELFDVAAQISAVSYPGGDFEYSKVSLCLGAYGIGYIFFKESPSPDKDLKKAFVSAMKKYVFAPLDISQNISLVNVDDPLFAASAFAIDKNGLAKWLEFETSSGNPEISLRRKASGKDRRGGIWLNSSVADRELEMCGDYAWETAHIIAVFPRFNAAFAAFAKGISKEASQLCAKALKTFAESLAFPSQKK